jgi:hypothetical protein
MRARRWLIALQQEVLEDLKADVRALLGRNPPALRRYYGEYKKEFRGYRRLVSREELVDALARSHLVYCGDYHTLRQAQRTSLRILRQLVGRRPIVLCLEMFMARHQKHLDAYLAGGIDEAQLLQAVDYARTWGFDWNHYRPLLELAREHGLRVRALNSRPYEEKVGLAERDRFAARVIARATMDEPGALVFVLFGDLHLARCHLPARVDEILRAHRARRRRTIVYQNSETLYWKLTRAGVEHEADVLLLRRGLYCVMNTAPWVKLQSYLHWTRQAPELTSKTLGTSVDEADPEDFIPYGEELYRLCRVIARFLGLGEVEVPDVEVYTLDDLSFLERMRRDRRYSILTALVRQRESFFLPDRRLLYLASLGVNRAAEEAGIYLLYRCSGIYPGLDATRDAFYERAFARAIGYFASKIVNHKRKCPRLKDYQLTLDRLGHRRKLSPADAHSREIARAVLRHQERLERAAAEGRRVNIAGAYRADPEHAFRISRAIGMMVGDALYGAVIQGRATGEEVRALFRAGRSPSFDPFGALAGLHRSTENVAVEFESKDDYF